MLSKVTKSGVTGEARERASKLTELSQLAARSNIRG